MSKQDRKIKLELGNFKKPEQTTDLASKCHTSCCNKYCLIQKCEFGNSKTWGWKKKHTPSFPAAALRTIGVSSQHSVLNDLNWQQIIFYIHCIFPDTSQAKQVMNSSQKR